MIGDSKWLSRFTFLSTVNPISRGFYGEDDFSELLQLETRRVRRSMRPLSLVLIGLGDVESWNQKQKVVRGIVSQLFSSTREIDGKGWFREGSVIGVLFREIGAEVNWSLAQQTIMRRMLLILDTVSAPHSAVSWHLLASSAAERQGADDERLENLQRVFRNVDPKFERKVPKNEYVDLERAPIRGSIL
jgi:hypothetical protein